jgi:hypothetical protein
MAVSDWPYWPETLSFSAVIVLVALICTYGWATVRNIEYEFIKECDDRMISIQTIADPGVRVTLLDSETRCTEHWQEKGLI